jgi:sulfur carrier protein ThiS
VRIDLWLYGPLAQYADGERNRSAANQRVQLPAGSRLKDLLAKVGVPTAERGITFINGNLTAMPGKQPDLDHLLSDGDRVALFHLNSMWPYQYRHGVAMGKDLEDSAKTNSTIFHHQSS